jgi:hypothetical protein
MTDQPFSSSKARLLEGLLAGAVLEEMIQSRPVRRIEPTLAGVEARIGGDFVAILRENLRAASQHAAMGHESPSFRECPHPMCCDAANLISYLPGGEAGANDADLDAVFERVLTALDYGLFDPAPDSNRS